MERNLMRWALVMIFLCISFTGCSGKGHHDGGSSEETSEQSTALDETSGAANQSADAFSAIIVSPSSDITIAAGQSLSFQSSVSGGNGNITCVWSFGGAAPDSPLLNPANVSFPIPGIYTVTFTATDSNKNASSDRITVTVAWNNGVPVAVITSPSSDMSILAGQSVTFEGNAVGGDGGIAYAWSFGGAAPDSHVQNPGAVTFSSPGSYTATFTAQDQDGDTSSDTVTVIVSQSNTAPVAAITSPESDTSIFTGQTVTFAGAVSGGNGTITYAWSFDGAAPDSSLQNPGPVVFSSPGNYTITMTVQDQDGDTGSDSVEISVTLSNTVPVATIALPVADTTILAGQFVTFQGTVSGGDAEISYAWSFGGAAPDSALQNPGSVVFLTPGRYTVVFTARDRDGDMSSDSVAITVEEDTAPAAVITSPSADVTAQAGQAVLFQGSVSGGNARFSYRWSFGGGAADSRVEDPGNVRFLLAGTYTVTFTVTDSDGDTGSDTVTVTVTPGTNAWTFVEAGFSHSAALKSDGSLWAWGNNNSGQLGDAGFAEKIVPTRIGDRSDWLTLSLGYYHTLSIKQDSTLWAWGENGNGQVGDGTLIDKSIPVRIGQDSDWAAVDAGYYHNLALKTDGSLWAWGYNSRGQLGNGSNTDRYTPTRIGSDTDWSGSAAGAYHSVALKSDGSLWAWGYNSRGQLGDGTTVDKSVPARIGSDTDWVAAAAGLYHTIALKIDGSLWAWGYNSNGQLGDGTHSNRLAPVRIGTEANWAQVSVGSYHTTALKFDGSLWAWGSNAYGQLGDGSATDRVIPQRIGGIYDWRSITAGMHHCVSYKMDGSLWAWGSNSFGQLGNGTKVNSYSPLLIDGD